MIDATDPDQGGDFFVDVDAALTVFALANGTDLSKGPGYRRLEWFSEGLERAILLEPGTGSADEARFSVKVLAWRSGHASELSEEVVEDGVAADFLSSVLSGAIDLANALDAPE
jgi:hypothetical protein